MGSYRLAEIAVSLIEAHIKSSIATALANVRTDRADALVTTEPPFEYFQYEMANVFRAPAIFTIIRGQDIKNERGANHINAEDDIIVAAVVEDRIQRLVVKKAWRYQAALMATLHLTTLTSADSAVRLFIRVQNCEFSGVINLKDPKAPEAIFRKEVSLRLKVEHVENLEV